MWTEFIYGLGDLLLATFKILPILGNNFNALIVLVGFVMFFWWLNQMSKYNKKAAEEGSLK